MPMFTTPKPRQFRYQPRFYNPERERWEALKQKYADERTVADLLSQATQTNSPTNDDASNDADLEYFQRRLREIENNDKAQQRGLTWKDLFRRREMPKFNYQPRFSDNEKNSTADHLADFKKRSIKIKRRYDISEDDYMKPIPAGRIMLYVALVCMLLYWILF